MSDLQPDRPWERDESAVERAKRDSSSANRGCLGLVIAIVLLAGGCGLLFSGDDDEYQTAQITAQAGCQGFVERRLKAPDGADFSAWSAVPGPGSTWTVSGTVDAENSFGAKIRSSFRCEMRDAGDRWVLTSIEGP